MKAQRPYSQARAMLAIAKGAWISMLRSPFAVLFSIAFPIVFILVFGLLGFNQQPRFKIMLHPASDTANLIYERIQSSDNIRMVQYQDSTEMLHDLDKGIFAGVLRITPGSGQDSSRQFHMDWVSSASAVQKSEAFIGWLQAQVFRIDSELHPDQTGYASISTPHYRAVQPYKSIDFLLPGLLGFSLLSAGVFGVAFLFFHLRELLVLKRFFATPIQKMYIILGEGLARTAFQLMATLVVILAGKFFFDFTLIHGLLTVVELLIVSAIGLMVFMAFGFVISGLARNQASIPALANMFTLPQFLLAGTFFDIDLLPAWLQPIGRILPLTFLNDALRKISFEGLHLHQVWFDIAMLSAWGLVAYILSVKTFKWE